MIWTDCYKELVYIIEHREDFLDMIPDEYEEIRERMREAPEIEHIDMWHEQISFLEEEHAFHTPAVFIEFNTLGIEDEGVQVQRLHTQIDFRLYYETFSDTYEGALMQQEALSFLELLTLLGMMFHGRSGKTFGTLRRTHVGREDSGGAGNLYRISFECDIIDYSTITMCNCVDMQDKEINIEDEKIPEQQEEQPLYDIAAR